MDLLLSRYQVELRQLRLDYEARVDELVARYTTQTIILAQSKSIERRNPK